MNSNKLKETNNLLEELAYPKPCSGCKLFVRDPLILINGQLFCPKCEVLPPLPHVVEMSKKYLKKD